MTLRNVTIASHLLCSCALFSAHKMADRSKPYRSGRAVSLQRNRFSLDSRYPLSGWYCLRSTHAVHIRSYLCISPCALFSAHKMADCSKLYRCGRAVSLQRDLFRKNPSIKLILVTRSIGGIVCGTNRPSRSKLKRRLTDNQTDRQAGRQTDRQTDRQTQLP